METLTHRVAPGTTLPETARYGSITNPSLGVEIGRVPLADEATVDAAVTGAHEVWREWRKASVATRTRILFAFRQLLIDNAEEIKEAVNREHGKDVDDAAGELARGLEVVEFATGIANLLKGEHSAEMATGIDVHGVRQSLGVVAVISPFNFPAMVPLWFVPIAIACGNAVVLKPSEKVPTAADILWRLWHEAGLPDGVLTVLHGDGDAANALIRHPKVTAVSFVGSTPVARAIYRTASAETKRVQALGGAKNHMIVLPDADLDAAASACVSAAYGSSGERCMAVSVVAAHESIAGDLVARVAEKAKDLRVGGPDTSMRLGPLITEAHRDRVARLVTEGVDAGATAVLDGRKFETTEDPNGYWIGPTLFDNVTPEMSVYREEIFGPVLSVVRIPSLEAGLELINDNPYGNGAAIFTRDGGAARTFEREAEAGMIGVNVPIPVPVAQYSFGGWGDSRFGDLRAYGPESVTFFTRSKSVTTRWPNSRAEGPKLAFPSDS